MRARVSFPLLLTASCQPSEPPPSGPVCELGDVCREGPPSTPPERLVRSYDERLHGVIVESLSLLRRGRDLQTDFAHHLVINPGVEPTTPASQTLVVEVIRDERCLANNEATTCCSPEAAQAELADELTVRGVCVATAARGRHPARLRCSAQALGELIEVSNDDPHDLPLLFTIGHELSHLAQHHDGGCFLSGALRVPLRKSPTQRLEDVVGMCQTYEHDGRPDRLERGADADALWLVRAVLDDMTAPGVAKMVPPERGGLGEIPDGYIDEDGRELRPRQGRGERIPFLETAERFFTAAEALERWRTTLGEGNAVSRSHVLAYQPNEAPSRDRVDEMAHELLCELLTSPMQDVREFELPTLPGATHPDVALRLALVGDTLHRIAGESSVTDVDPSIPSGSEAPISDFGNIDRILTFANDVSAARSRWRAAYAEELGDATCELATHMTPGLSASPRAVDCEASIPRRRSTPCSPFAVELLAWERAPEQREVKATWSGSTVELDAPVTTALLTVDGMMLGVDESNGDEAAIGLLPWGQRAVPMDVVHCTPTALASLDGEARAFCREPLAMASVAADGSVLKLEKLVRLKVDGEQIDGFIEGDLDRDGNPLDQSLYQNPLVHGFRDRYDVPIMRTAKVVSAITHGASVFASLQVKGGRSREDRFFEGLDVTMRVDEQSITALRLRTTAGECGSLLPGCMGGGGETELPRWMIDRAGRRVFDLDAEPPVTSTWPQAATSCLWSPMQGEVLCIDEQGSVRTTTDVEIARFSLALGTQIVDACATRDAIFLQTRIAQPGTLARYDLIRLGGDGRQSSLHHELYFEPTLGSSCGLDGAVAWFREVNATTLVFDPARPTMQVPHRLDREPSAP